MKINLKQTLEDLDGNEITESGKKIDAGYAIRQALLAKSDTDKADDKIKKYELAKRCIADEVDLKAEDIALIKKTVGDLYTPLVVGRVYEIIDP
jgi:hypothetical protein